MIYFWSVKHSDSDARKQFDSELNRPPRGATAEQVQEVKGWVPGSAGADFMAQMAARGGTGRVSRSGVRNVK